MKTNDYVKYMTQTFVQYIDQPKEERKKMRLEHKEAKGSFLFRWFGIMPYLLMSQVKRRKKR
ncbi:MULTISPECIES: YqzE family protein [unclassified Bacillus (in: firmicutes)]|uniref:YqzE family protein n=1 Tax=unclassified Bacillus (in: firmicutes) TaxID=185979 RepID=UPI0008E04729|nr:MULTISPECIES: YqzE family protein [unclassified Bacillus (in: firmicutes)]SFA96451.1 YqzE-like protein [Bacillus sp. UNCCL13]SFQ79788.1 YqzE-like protein [Bacillus sp. cl95]